MRSLKLSFALFIERSFSYTSALILIVLKPDDFLK